MAKQAKPFLSIIIPAYNEEKRLSGTLEKVLEFLGKQNYAAEVIVVENGSQDGTYQIAASYAEDHPHIQAIHEEQRGKGLAVRRGMLAARGAHRFMCDADLSMPIEELARFLPPLAPDTDIVIGSREAPGAKRYREPSYRHIGGRAINAIIRFFALPGLHDTQCGFKCFRAEVAEDLFPRQTLTGWSFDVELLYIARLRGYRIAELPIPWYYSEESHVKPMQDFFRLMVDVLVLRWNALRGRYVQKI